MRTGLSGRFLLVPLLLLSFNANAGTICAITQSFNGCNDIPVIPNPIISIPVQPITFAPVIISNPVQFVFTPRPITITTPVIHGMSGAWFSEGVYHYEYRFNPASNPLVNQFVVPYFSDAQISNFQMPTYWISSIANPSSLVSEMKWTYVGSTSLTVESPWIGFLFDSPFAPSQASIKEIATDGSVVNYEYGMQIPLSPLAIQAGFVSLSTPVAEPETLLMLVAGLGVMGFVARRKAK